MESQQSLNNSLALHHAVPTSFHEISSYTDPVTAQLLGQFAPVGIPQITNEAFVEALFPTLSEQASAVVCSKNGDPSVGGWIAIPTDDLAKPLSATFNNYINCASFRPDQDGRIMARKANFAASHFIMLDDIGTKVSFERLGGFKLSWLIETSPGNHQAGILLDTPVSDKGQLDQLLNSIVGAGLCDPGATGATTRWARMPQGINGKPKYKSLAGEPFKCRLVQWAPHRRYTIAEIVEGLALPPVDTSNPTPSDHGECLHQDGGLGSSDDSWELTKLNELLAVLDPDCGYREWLSVLMAIFHATGGSDDGLALADHWSSGGSKYKGHAELQLKWRSFQRGTPNPVTLRTLMSMAASAGADVRAIMQAEGDGFEVCQTVVVPSAARRQMDTSPLIHPLGKYSVSGDLEALERQMVEQKPLLGNIALVGQATAIYASPNTGKTLIVLHLIIDAINKGFIDPKNFYYINMDDNSSGLVDKARLASEYGFHMLADGHQGFAARDFRKAMEAMIEAGTARGVVVVLDTLKKFVNTMDKGNSSDFAKIVRRFCMKGGTVIALSHANKNPGADGKPVYSGTSDIVDDFDCAYTMATVSMQTDAHQKVVEFSNFKRRGNVAPSVAYSYSLERNISYNELLLSVHEVDAEQLLPIKRLIENQSDAVIIAALKACISSENNTKMKMVDAAARNTSTSQRAVLKVIEKYTGQDPSIHHWTYAVGNRGAKMFVLLDHPTEDQCSPAQKAF